MILPEELIRKVRRIELTTRKMVDDAMSGQYKSQFKGQGVQFSEHRVYVPGDDVRHIDWKVSARTRDPLIKKYEEERELTVFLIIDVSGSGHFGSQTKLKSEAIAEIASMLAYAAIQTGDKVGALLFAGEVERIIPPKKGKQHILRIITEVLGRDRLGAEMSSPAVTPRPGTNLAGALEAAGRIMKHSGVVFLITDFIAQGYDKQLKRLARRHDVVALQVGDDREGEVPSVGHLLLVDPETGVERWVNTGAYAFRKWLEEYRAAGRAELQAATRAGGVELVRLRTQEDYAEAIVRFFHARSRRSRR